jgi:hypothetical protein
VSTNSGTTVAQDPSQSLYTPPLTFTANSCLSEDYLLTTDIPVNTAPGSVAMWQNAEGRSEALVIDPNNKLSHIYRDPDSDSGWSSQPVAAELKVGEVVVAKDAGGTVNAFLSVGAGGDLYHLRQNPDGSWPDKPDDLQREATRLSVEPYYLFDWTKHKVAQAGLLVCGVTPNFQQVWVGTYATNGTWTWNQFTDSKIQELIPSTFGIQVSGMPSGPVVNELVVVLSTVIDGKMCYKSFAPSNLKQQPYPKDWTPVAAMQGPAAPTTLVDFARVQAAESLGCLLAIDKNGSLWIMYLTSVSGSDSVRAYFHQVPTVTAARVSGTQQPQNPALVQLYVTDVNGSLWVVRQSQTDGSNIPTWDDPVPLDDDVYRTVTPKGSNSRAEAFALGASPTGLETTTLRLFSQDPTTTDWAVLPVQQSAPPDEDPTHVSSYLTTVTVSDANGVPALGEEVKITSLTSPVTIWVNGSAYDVDSDQPVSCQTDFTGKLNIMSPAMGLHTPSLILTTDGSTDGQAASITVNPYQQVHDYLAGGDNTTLNDLPAFNGTALQNAKGADGNRLVPGLTSDGAQNTANMIKQAMALRPPSSPTASATSPAPRSGPPQLTASGEPAAGWKMDFSDPTTPTFAPVSSAEIAAHRTQLQGQLLGGVADDLKRFMGDVWHAIRHGAMKVDQLVVDTVNRAVHLTLKGFGDLGEIVIREGEKGIEDIVHVIHTIFAAIGAEIERVVEWLRALFNWDDILNTHKVLEYYLKNLTTPLRDLIDNHAKTGVNEFFTGLEQKISDECDDLKEKLQGKNLTHLASGSSWTTGGDMPTDNQGTLDPSVLHSHPQHHWVFAKAQANAAGTTGLGVDADDSVLQPVADFVKAVDSAIPDIEDGLKKIGEFIRGMVKHPADIKQLVVNDLIDVIKDMVVGLLKVADGVVQALLDLADLALDGIESFLTKPTKIPLLSALFKKITKGEELTVAGLLALIVAAPATLGYKLVHGVDKKLFTDAMVAQLTSPAPTDTLRAAPQALVGDASDNKAASDALAWTSASVQAVWAVCDTALDTKPDVKTPVFKGLFTTAGVGLPMLAQATWWPNDDGVPFHIPADTEYHKWNIAMWSWYWAPIALDLIFLGAGGLTNMKEKWPGLPISGGQLARYEDPWGNYVLGFIGSVTFILSCVASALGAKDGVLEAADVGANVFGALSYVGQPLRIESIQGPYLEVPLAIQLLNDFFTGLVGCAGCMFISAAES